MSNRDFSDTVKLEIIKANLEKIMVRFVARFVEANLYQLKNVTSIIFNRLQKVGSRLWIIVSVSALIVT